MEENSCAPSSSSSQPVDLSSRRSGQVHLLSWSDHFTRRDLVRKGSDDVNLQLPRKRQKHLRPFVIDGLANIVEAFGLKIVSIPDLIVRLVDSFTQHRLNTAGSKVFMQLSLSGTIGSQALVRCYKNQHCDASWLLPGFLVESLRLSGHTFHSQVAGDETLSSTYSMNNCSWWIVLHLDNNHRVYQMSIDGKVSIQPN
eukprot:gene8701-9587_t